jgi:hypothetical protein
MGTMLDETFMDPNDPEPEEEKPVVDEPGQAAAEESGVAPEKARTPISRRKRAAEAQETILAEMRSLREDSAKEREQRAERESRYERDLAELRGQNQALMSRPQYREEPKKDDGPDPDKLIEEANAALDRKDYATWQKKNNEANVAASVRAVRAILPQQQAQQPQMNPLLYGIASQFPEVMGNRVAMRAAQNHDLLLAEQGIPEGPERWKKSFEEGKRYLGAQNGNAKPAGYSAKSREVLGSQPARSNGSGGGKGEPGVVLSSAELGMAKKFKMSPEEYAQHLVAMHPERRVDQ